MRPPPSGSRPAPRPGFRCSAADLMPAYTGAALGAELARLEAEWIASDFTLDRAALLGR